MSANSMLEATIAVVSIAFILSPGVLLSRYLFRDESTVWHFGVGGGLGVAISGYVALILSYSPLRVTPFSFAVFVLGLDILGLALLLSDWGKVREAMAQLRRHHWKERVSSALTLALVLVTLALMQPLGKLRKESFTEFYIVEEDPKTAIWRQEIHSLALVPLQIEVVSHETHTAAYKVHVLTEGRIAETIDLGSIEPNNTVRRAVVLSPPVNDSQRYDFILYKDGATKPYRALFFWLKTSLDAK